MYVNGCHIAIKLCSNNDEGFSSMVSRSREVSAITPGDAPVVQTIERGPFATIREAQVFAHEWNEFDSPPPMPFPTTPPIQPKDEPKSSE